jgi:hypothetical protein
MPKTDLNALRAMVHFVTRKYAMEPDQLGSTKLHKILWWTEIRTLRRLNQQAANETFRKKPFGPFSNHLMIVVDELVADRKLMVRPSTEDFEVTLYVGKGEADRSALSEEHWRILEDVAEWIVRDHTANSASEKSHGQIWDSVQLEDPMPVEAAAIRITKTSEGVREKFKAALAL